MDTAMMVHFNIQTPHQTAAAPGAARTNFQGLSSPLPVRPAKRGSAEDDGAAASEQPSLEGCATNMRLYAVI